MKRTLLYLIIAAGFSGLRTTVQSQDDAPVPAPALAPVAPIPNGPPLAMLKAMRDANAKLIEQQAATLQKLDEMEKAAQTLKVLGKRS